MDASICNDAHRSMCAFPPSNGGQSRRTFGASGCVSFESKETSLPIGAHCVPSGDGSRVRGITGGAFRTVNAAREGVISIPEPIKARGNGEATAVVLAAECF